MTRPFFSSDLLVDDTLRVVALDGCLDDTLWKAHLPGHICAERLTDKLAELGLRGVSPAAGVWRLELTEPSGDRCVARMLVLDRSRTVALIVDPTVAAEARRDVALRLAQTLALVVRSFGRRSWRPRRPSVFRARPPRPKRFVLEPAAATS